MLVSVATEGGCGGVMETGGGGLRGSIADPVCAVVPLGSGGDVAYFSFNSHSKRTKTGSEMIGIAPAETTLSE